MTEPHDNRMSPSHKNIMTLLSNDMGKGPVAVILMGKLHVAAPSPSWDSNFNIAQWPRSAGARRRNKRPLPRGQRRLGEDRLRQFGLPNATAKRGGGIWNPGFYLGIVARSQNGMVGQRGLSGMALRRN